jgi:Lar family restriction alleviation protein
VKLKPCPFCGGSAVMTKRERMDIPNWVEFYICCDRYSCKVKPHVSSFASPKEAVQCWNRRKGVDDDDTANARLDRPEGAKETP